jgi:hypothetical protein
MNYVIEKFFSSTGAGLPDGLLSNQKSQFGEKILGPQIGKC